MILFLSAALGTHICAAAMGWNSGLSRPALRVAPLNASVERRSPTPAAKDPNEISLDYHSWQSSQSTFVVVREDGSVKLVISNKRDLTITEHQEGVLAPSDAAELFTMIRSPAIRKALRLRKRYIRDWGDADLFYLSSRTPSGEQSHWFSAGERAPRIIFVLVDRMLNLSKKIERIKPGSFDRYLRAERLTPEDTRNVLKKVKPFEINECPPKLQEVFGRAVAHPREFFLLSAEQAGELQNLRTSMLRHGASIYSLQLYDSFLIPPGKLEIIKPPK